MLDPDGCCIRLFTSLILTFLNNYNVYGRLSRCDTVRGSSVGLSKVSPAKVEAHKSVLFAESVTV